MVDLNEDSINLRALKKIDDNIREIVLCAGQVAVYYYDVNQNGWNRKNIEGTLFFVRRGTPPEYAFVVINRLNTINFVQKITKDFSTNMQSPYLMYKNNENEIYCIWFYDQDQCVAINENIVNTVNRIKKSPCAPGESSQYSIQNNQEQINGLNSTNSKSISNATMIPTNKQPNSSELLKKMLCMDNNTDQLGLFAGESVNAMVFPGTPPQPDLNSMKPSPKLPNKNDNRSTTPKQQNDLVKPIAQRRSFNLNDLFNSHLTINETTTSSTPIKEASGDNLLILQQPAKNDVLSSSLNASTFLTDDIKKKSLASASTSILPPFNNSNFILKADQLHQKVQDIVEMEDKPMVNPATIPNFDALINQQKNMANCIPNVLFDIQPTPSPAAVSVSNSSKPSAVATITTKNSNTDNPLYLSMEQLKKTMIYLLMNDADFLHTIHTAYVANIKK